jgi:hypothetical protein
VIEIVSKRGMHIRQRELRESSHDVVGRLPLHFMPDGNILDSNPVPGHARLAAANARRDLDVVIERLLHIEGICNESGIRQIRKRPPSLGGYKP